MSLNRRQYLHLAGKNLLSLGLLGLLQQTSTARDAAQEEIVAWTNRLQNLGSGLGNGKLSQQQWKHGMDELYGSVSLASLMQAIDFGRVSDQLSRKDLAGKGEIFHTLFVGEPGNRPIDGTPEPSCVVISKIAHLKKGRSIPPHGHSNMVSAFLVLSGDIHVRQFDKVQDLSDALVLKRSADERQSAGNWSSVTDERNNVHWLTAKSDDCFLFTTKLIKLSDKRKFEGRGNVDVLAATDLGHGLLNAPKISTEHSNARY